MSDVIGKSPKSKTKFISFVRQIVTNNMNGQRLYKHVVNPESITSVEQIESYVLMLGNKKEQKDFFEIIQEQENSFTPVMDTLFAFSRKNDSTWYQQNIA